MVIRLALLVLMILALPLRAESPPLPPGGARLMILHDHGNPVVAEMVKLTLRGEYDLTVSLEEMRFPDGAAYDWIQIDRDRWFKERIGGRMTQIFERDIALFPRTEGVLEVGPVHHDLTHVARNGQRDKLRVTSGKARLNVRPFPGGHRPLTARALVLTDELSAEPGRLQKDEVLTRRVTIEALDALPHHLPPRPDLQQPWLISFTQPEIRDTRPTAQGPVSRVVWEWQLRPRTGEPGVLPAVAFPWFDTDGRRIEVAAMKPIPFGFAGFGSNFGGSGRGGVRMGLTVMALLGLGLAFALIVALGDRLPRPEQWPLRRSPHQGAMTAAVASGNLPALRAAAVRQVAWQNGASRQQAVLLDQLDAHLFGRATSELDADAWLTAFRRAASGRRRSRPSGAAVREG
ncbi:hypothetical protein [Paracoccus sp. (in: a-proteobacteria)]|uniref:hypothetical protein n=1 Tax=Paracoccus sp. TaxID=267 RepID=UPI00396C4F73